MIDKIKIGSCQINVDFEGKSYLPYSIGLLQAYILHNSKNPSRFEFQTTIFERQPLLTSVDKLKENDIVLFSNYVWNEQINLQIANKLKKENPNILIIFGGPSVPDLSESYLRKHSFIDICSHQEGERTILSILDCYPLREWKEIPGVSFINNNEFIYNSSLPRLRNFEGCPSPFLSGTFNKLLNENPNHIWLATWETNRGCPFSCTYCDWGSAINSKVAKFEMDRLFAEIDWFAEHKIEFVNCCDANFGMLKRDYDIIAYMAEVKKKTGHPGVLSIQSTKNARERSYAVQKLLYDSGLARSINIAMQATDPHTLKAIKRDNISIVDYQELQRRFTKDGVPTFTDLIAGLPGDTYDKFARTVSDVISAGQCNQINFNDLVILPNAEMAEPNYMKKWGIETVQGILANIHESIPKKNDILEKIDMVVATKDMPQEDWIKSRVFAHTSEVLYFRKLLQIPILIVYAKHSRMSFKEIFEKFTNINDKKQFPAITFCMNILRKSTVDMLTGAPPVVPSKEWLGIYWPSASYAIIELIDKGLLKDFYRETYTVLCDIMNDKSYNDILEEAVWFNYELFKKPNINSNKTVTLNYNIHDFYNNVIIGRNVDIKKGKYKIKINRINDGVFDSKKWAREVMWYRRKSGNYLYASYA